jgi:hypothetical protein
LFDRLWFGRLWSWTLWFWRLCEESSGRLRFGGESDFGDSDFEESGSGNYGLGEYFGFGDFVLENSGLRALVW